MGGPFVFKYQSKDVTGKRVRYSTIKSSNQVIKFLELQNLTIAHLKALMCWYIFSCREAGQI